MHLVYGNKTVEESEYSLMAAKKRELEEKNKHPNKPNMQGQTIILENNSW